MFDPPIQRSRGAERSLIPGLGHQRALVSVGMSELGDGELTSIQAIDHRELDTAKKIVSIQQHGYAVEAELMGFDGIPPLHDEVADVQELRNLAWMAAFDDRAMVGVIAWSKGDESIEVDRLAVHPAWSRRGHGRRLVRRVPRTQVTVASTGSLNLPAVALYQSEGFVQIGKTEVAPGVFTSQFRREPLRHGDRHHDEVGVRPE